MRRRNLRDEFQSRAMRGAGLRMDACFYSSFCRYTMSTNLTPLS